MKTTDIFKLNRDSRRINESMEKIFGKKLNLESFDLPQLEDARNKLRTQISQVRSESKFNENIENEAYTQAQFMLDAINSEIAQREEFIVDAVSTGRRIKKSQVPAWQRKEKGGNWKVSLKDLEDEESHYDSSKKGIARLKKELNMENSTGDNMHKLQEGEIQQAQSIVTAKTMVDRVGRWIEELSGMENDTLLQLGDQIRDEMGAALAKSFITSVAPAIQQALENLKTTRETLATGVRTLTGEEQGAEMLGAEPVSDMTPPGDEIGSAEPDLMNPTDLDAGPPEDEFAAAEPATGGIEAAGRAKRESIEFQNNLLKVLAG